MYVYIYKYIDMCMYIYILYVSKNKLVYMYMWYYPELQRTPKTHPVTCETGQLWWNYNLSW